MSKKDILLVAMPWQMAERPSVQLGALKAYLCSKGLRADARHLYLDFSANLGHEKYASVSRLELAPEESLFSLFLGDMLFAFLLYPGQRRAITAFLRRHGKEDFLRLIPELKAAADKVFESVRWGDYSCVGFTITYLQLFSSVYFAGRIKERFPGVRTVFGGLNCVGEMGRGILDCFPEVDLVMQGEGEAALAALLKAGKDLSSVPNLLRRGPGGKALAGPRTQFKTLLSLPVPDYSDYFRVLKKTGAEIEVSVPVETSRGCWFTPKCTYCSFNCVWEGYRTKPSRQILAEVRALASRHGVRRFFMTDSVLAPRIDVILPLLRSGRFTFSHSYLRVPRERRFLEALSGAGLTHTVIGIEALSESLLRKMAKGNTVIENIQAIKWCEELGLNLFYNLIPAFPTETLSEVLETIENLGYLRGFRPPFLPLSDYMHLYGSEVFEKPGRYNIKSSRVPAVYSVLLPSGKAAAIRPFFREITLKRPFSRAHRDALKRLRDGVREWSEGYKSGRFRLLMSGGPRRLRILDSRSGTERVTELCGPAAALYLYCAGIRSSREVRSRFPRSGRLLAGFVREKMMFSDGKNYLSLAVPAAEEGGR